MTAFTEDDDIFSPLLWVYTYYLVDSLTESPYSG